MPWICFFLTGLSALVCEVCWIRKASLALGSASWALSCVLAVFFAGLAIGSFVVGRRARGSRSPLRLYAGLELGVGAWVLASPWLFAAADVIYGSIYSQVFSSSVGLAAARLAVLVFALLPATIMMGGSLPLLCLALARHNVLRGVGALYAINTLGAAIGAALTGLVLLPTIGVNASLALAGAINLVVGAIALRIAPEYEVDQPISTQVARASANIASANIASAYTASQRRVLAGLFFGVGFVAVGSEVLWTRYLSLWMPNTVYTYSLTLFVILIGIVLGSGLSAGLGGRVGRPAVWLGWLQILAAWATLGAMLWRPAWWGNRLDAISAADQLFVLGAIMLIPSVLSGASFPLAVSLMIDRPQELGRETGRMTAINLLGGIVGSLAVGFMAIPMLGLQASLYAVTAIGVALGLSAWWRLDPTVQIGLRLVRSCVALTIAVAIPTSFRTQLPKDLLGLDGQLVDYREGFNANVSVVRQGELLRLEINRMWQGQNQKNHQVFAAHIPAILHRDPREVLVVGLGTGQTASSFLVHAIDKLDCVEIEDGLIDLVRHHFDGQWMDDPRVRMIIEDGRNYVTHTDRQYDIISIEVGQIYRPRIASFYSLDFYEQLKPRLKARGIVCQFMPIEFFGPDEFRTLLATFNRAFPESLLWYNTSELLLVGTADDRLSLDLVEFRRRLESNPRLRSEFDYAYWAGPEYYLSRPESLLAGYLCGPAQVNRLGEGGVIYRDDRPFLEYLPVRAHSDAPAIVAMLERQLSPFNLLVGSGPGPDMVARAQRIRLENVREIAARTWLAQAQLLRAAGNDEEEFAALKSALEALPNYPPANIRLAEFLQGQGEQRAAVGLYQRALAVKPGDTKTRLRCAQAQMMIGELGQAEEQLRAVLAVDQQSIEALTELGWLLGQSGRNREALVALESALKLDERATRALLGVANVLQSAGDRAEAQRVYRQALAIDPGMTEARLGLALSLQSAGNHDGALSNFEEILGDSPDNIVALNAAAWLLATHPQESRRDPQRSIQLADRAWQLTGGQLPETADALAAAHAAQGKFQRAIEIIDLSIAAAKKLDAQQLIPQLEARRQRYSEGKPYFEAESWSRAN